MRFHRLNACLVRRKGDNPWGSQTFTKFDNTSWIWNRFLSREEACWQVPKLPDRLCRGLVSGTIHSCKAHLRNKVLAKRSSRVRTCQNSGRYHRVSKVEAHGSTLAYSILQWLSSQQERILKCCPNVSKKQATEWATQLGLGVNERKHGSTEVGKRLLTNASFHGFPCHVFSIKQETRRSEVVCPRLSYSSNLKSDEISTVEPNEQILWLCLRKGCDMLRR